LDVHRRRTRWLTLIFLAPFLIIVGRLWILQVGESDDLSRKAHSNLVRTLKIEADRGTIYDRGGRVLAGNRVAYDVMVDPRYLKDKPEALALLTEFLSLSETDVERVAQRLAARGARQFIARKDASRDQVALVETNRVRLPGVSVRTRSHRHYPYNEWGAHTIGFMNELTAKELAQLRTYGYESGDLIGRTGIERAYEAVLRGSPGFDRHVVDARGIPQGEEAAEDLLGQYRSVAPIPGRDLRLTMDMDVQEILMEEFSAHKSGAIVAMDPRDG
jgi:penicillin-binding protein 2